MPIAKDTLESIARTYVTAMSSIRGRRIHRLLIREFARFDHVLPATTEANAPALLAISEQGSAAVCQTDGRGESAAIVEWARLEGAALTISYDLLKDSLPVVGWTLWHPGFAHGHGELTISSADLSDSDRRRITDALRKLGAERLSA